MIKPLNFLSHPREENGDPLYCDEGHHLDHEEHRSVLDEAHHGDGRGGEHLVEARRLLGGVGGEGAVEGPGDGGDVQLRVVARDGVDNTQQVSWTQRK